MAKGIKAEVIRGSISSSLIKLESFLQDNHGNVIKNAWIIKSAINSIKTKKNGSDWQYKISGLQIEVKVPQNTIPATCKGSLFIEMDLFIGGDCDKIAEGELTNLILNLIIRNEDDTNYCAWHFDRHIEEGKPPEEAHPLYHFQHGGHAMKDHNDYLGRSLLLPAPRLPFPPMDAVLAIDFVLSNFSGEYWKSLREKPAYNNLLAESQKRFWKPYLKRVSSWWEDGFKSEQERGYISSLFPLIV